MKTYLRLDIAGDNARARFLKRLARSRRTNINMRSDAQALLNQQRSELRSEHLALGFLRGRPYDVMEKPLRAANEGHLTSKNLTRTFPDFERVQQIVEDFGELYFENKQALAQQFAEWHDNALEGVQHAHS